MEGVLKIVRRRLQVANEISAQADRFHPDAALLAAFAEQSLTTRERLAVFDHLAQCADCREVVFLAAPQLDAPQMLSRISAKPRWLPLPVVRWGVLGACALVVVAVTFRYEGEKSRALSPREAAPAMISKAIVPAVPEQPIEIQSQLKSAKPQKAWHKASETNASRFQISRSRDGERPASPIVPERHAARAVPKFPMQFDGPQSAIRKLPPAERVPASGVAELQSRRAGGLDDANRVDANPEEHSHVDSESASAGQVSSAAESLNATGRNASHLTSLPSAPRWMLASTGGLQRSLDEGRSWAPVPVASDVSFHALSVQGPEIWVGGAGGALYHSSDFGQRWTQIVLNSHGEPLKAEITRIEFSSPQDGALTTAAGESWITTDSGRSWQKK